MWTSTALRAAAAIRRAFRLRARQVREVGTQIIQGLTSLAPGAEALEGIGKANHRFRRARTLAVAAKGFVIGKGGILEIALAHQRIAQQQGSILRPRTWAGADRFPGRGLGGGEIALRKRGAAIRNGLVNRPRGVGGCRGWLGLRRRPRLRRARGGRSASPFLQGLQAEIQIAAQLFHLGAHLPIIILGHISATTQAAVFFFQFLHATKQLLHQIARSGRPARGRAWRSYRATAAPQRIKFPPQIQDLVLQRNALPAIHLSLCGGGKRQPQTQKSQTENRGKACHGLQAARPKPRPILQRTTVTARRFCAQELSSEPSAAG